MNRKSRTENTQRADLPAKASSLSERAARAMRPNGEHAPYALLLQCNVMSFRDGAATNDRSSFPVGRGEDLVRIGKELSRQGVSTQRPGDCS